MIQQVSHAKVWRWRAAAARERVDLSDSPATRWFMDDDIGCAGLLSLKAGVRLRGIYVDRAFRRHGIGTRLTEHLIQVAESEGVSYVEAYVWNVPWYAARGFLEVGVNAHGAVLMRRIFIPDEPQTA